MEPKTLSKSVQAPTNPATAGIDIAAWLLLLGRAQAAYARNNQAAMSIPAVAGFVGAWTLFDSVLGSMTGPITPDSIRAAALRVDVPTGDSINGGGVRFGQDGSLDEGQDPRAAAGA